MKKNEKESRDTLVERNKFEQVFPNRFFGTLSPFQGDLFFSFSFFMQNRPEEKRPEICFIHRQIS